MAIDKAVKVLKRDYQVQNLNLIRFNN